MPEGHTLHGLARDQTRHFAGKRVWVSSPQGTFAAGAGLVDGRILDAVKAHGKHLFAAFGELTVHVHLTGLRPSPTSRVSVLGLMWGSGRSGLRP